MNKLGEANRLAGASLSAGRAARGNKMAEEVAEIKSELENFGPDGFYSVPYTTMRRDYPMFAKYIIEAFLKSLSLVSTEELNDINYLNDAWQNENLVLRTDWPVLVHAAEDYYVPGKSLPDWGKLIADYDKGYEATAKHLKGYHESLIDDDDEDLVTCSWCGEEYPVSDCRRELDLGFLCPQCQQAIKSRGEELIFVESDCREVPCEAEEVISHSEDEKPLDCKMKKKPLEKPLTEENDIDENVNVNISADRPDELVSLAKALLGDDFDVFNQDFDDPVENIPAVEMEAGFKVDADKQPEDYKDPFEENPFDEPEKVEEPAESDEIPEAEENEFDKEMEANADKKPADDQPMDMIDGKLVPAKDPKKSEVEVDDEDLEEDCCREDLTPDEEAEMAEITKGGVVRDKDRYNDLRKKQKEKPIKEAWTAVYTDADIESLPGFEDSTITRVEPSFGDAENRFDIAVSNPYLADKFLFANGLIGTDPDTNLDFYDDEDLAAAGVVDDYDPYDESLDEGIIDTVKDKVSDFKHRNDTVVRDYHGDTKLRKGGRQDVIRTDDLEGSQAGKYDDDSDYKDISLPVKYGDKLRTLKSLYKKAQEGLNSAKGDKEAGYYTRQIKEIGAQIKELKAARNESLEESDIEDNRLRRERADFEAGMKKLYDEDDIEDFDVPSTYDDFYPLDESSNYNLDEIANKYKDMYEDNRFDLSEDFEFSDFDTQVDPETGEEEYAAMQDYYGSLKTWDCYCGDQLLGQVVAADENEAYQELAIQWPDCEDPFVEISEENFLEEFGKVIAERCNNLKKNVKLEEEGKISGLARKIADIHTASKTKKKKWFGLGLDEVFDEYYCKIEYTDGHQSKTANNDNDNKFSNICGVAKTLSNKDTVEQVTVMASKCNAKYKEIFDKAIEGFKLPVVLRVYQEGKCTQDKINDVSKRIADVEDQVSKQGEVEEKTGIDHLQIDKMPETTQIIHNRKIVLPGLTLAVRNGDDEKIIKDNYTIDPKFAPDELGKFTAKISYGGKSVDLELKSVDKITDENDDWYEKYKAEHPERFGKKPETQETTEPAKPATSETSEVNEPEQASEQPRDRKGDKLNRQVNNNKKINQALKDAGFNVDDFYTVYQDAAGRNRKKATDKLNNIRKALFGEELNEELNIPEDLDFDRFSNNLEYDDLGVEVEGEFGGEPVADNKPMWAPINYTPEYTLTGTLNNFDYEVDSCEDWYNRLVNIAANILNVNPEDLTQEMIDGIPRDEFEAWQVEEFRPDAEEAAKEYDWDYDDIEWDERYEPDYDIHR